MIKNEFDSTCGVDNLKLLTCLVSILYRLPFEISNFGCLSSDIDECGTQPDICHYDATCTNTDGSYSCSCNPGFSGDGVDCLGNRLNDLITTSVIG